MKTETLTLDDLKQGGGKAGPRPICWVTRFWKYVYVPIIQEHCWEWIGSVNAAGYGQLMINRVPRLAHRLSYLMVTGKIDGDKELMHLCDNRRCVNPGHLVLDTHRNNILDAVEKGLIKSGEKSPYAKLTDAQISDIRHRAFYGVDTYLEIAEEFGIHKDYVSNIVRWKVRKL